MDDVTDDTLKDILARARVIAVVGMSANPARPSHGVAQYLAQRGYRVIPVNPGLAGQTLLGETVRADLHECPPDTDMVDIFRSPEHVPAIVDAALAHLPGLRTIWMQLGIVNDAAAATARARGIDVVQDRCPKIEIPRLFG
jgi:predicted CoA-binding protein